MRSIDISAIFCVVSYQKTTYFSIGPRLKAYEIEGPYDKCMDARQLSREMLTCIWKNGCQ